MEQPPSSTPPELSPETSADSAAAGRTEMLFRFWGGNGRSSEPGNDPHQAGHDPGVLALIEDAVAAKRGASHAAQEYLYISRLKRPADALVVSRQVQLGLEGFRARHGIGPVAVSIAIHASAAAAKDPAVANPEPSHDLVTLLKLAKPAQILLTHDLCQQVTALKGLPLRSFPARFGVYEYLWTGEEKLELLQSEPQLTLTALPAAKDKPTRESTGAGAASVSPAVSAPASPPRAATKAFEAPEFAARKDADAEEPKSGLPRWAIFGGAGLAAVIALAAVGIHLAQKPAAAPASGSPPAQVAPAGNASPAAGSPTHSVRPAAHFPPQQGSAQQMPSQQIPAQKPHAAALPPAAAPQQAGAPAPGPEVKPAAPSAECTLGGDTSRYVSLAEQARGRGDYANAIRIFREVLACDPNNAAAREGLDKATQAQQQR